MRATAAGARPRERDPASLVGEWGWFDIGDGVGVGVGVGVDVGDSGGGCGRWP
jgi:hypothetical protein